MLQGDHNPRGEQQFVPGFGPDRCDAFLQGTEGAPPRESLLRVISLVQRERPAVTRMRALDLGCGPGRECVALLRSGFHVVAVDPYELMLQRARSLVANECPELAGNVEYVKATLERYAPSLRRDSFDVVHAGFVLPFVSPAAFDDAFAALRMAVAPGGYFVGQFFGPDDEFIRTSPPEAMTAHRASDIATLLPGSAGFEILEHDEVNREGRVGRGRSKWWHVHHVIARRRPVD